MTKLLYKRLIEKDYEVLAGTEANRPATGRAGRYYFSTDTNKWSRDSGAGWIDVAGGAGGAHALGGAQHTADTLANLNTKVSDATLDDSGASRTPLVHSPTHEPGGSDQVHAIGDNDDDTKIQVEEAADEDKIRMDVAGVEAFLLSDIGILTLAKQSAARAFNPTESQPIPNIAWTLLYFDNETFDIQNEYNTTVKSGAADATEANKLHDADGGFAASDVGAWIWNTTDETYTQVTGFVDSGELDLADNIMVNGETYRLYHSRFTAKEAGTYLVMTGVVMSAISDGTRFRIRGYKNGATFGAIIDVTVGGAGDLGSTGMTVVRLAANDYVDFRLYHDEGGAINALKNDERTYGAIAKIA